VAVTLRLVLSVSLIVAVTLNNSEICLYQTNQHLKMILHRVWIIVGVFRILIVTCIQSIILC